MASTLACSSDPSQLVHRPGDHDGKALQLHGDQGKPSRQDFDNPCPPRSSVSDVDELCSRRDEEGDGHEQLREGSTPGASGTTGQEVCR